MYRVLYRMPDPLVDAILTRGIKRPEWSDTYHQQVLQAWTEWQRRTASIPKD